MFRLKKEKNQISSATKGPVGFRVEGKEKKESPPSEPKSFSVSSGISFQNLILLLGVTLVAAILTLLWAVNKGRPTSSDLSENILAQKPLEISLVDNWEKYELTLDEARLKGFFRNHNLFDGEYCFDMGTEIENCSYVERLVLIFSDQDSFVGEQKKIINFGKEEPLVLRVDYDSISSTYVVNITGQNSIDNDKILQRIVNAQLLKEIGLNQIIAENNNDYYQGEKVVDDFVLEKEVVLLKLDSDL